MFGEQSCAGRGTNPCGSSGSWGQHRGLGEQTRRFQNISGKDFLEIPTLLAMQDLRVESCSQWCCSKSRVNLGESVKVTSGWEVTSHFPSRKWQQDLATPQHFSSSPLLPPLSKCLCWIVSRFTLEIRAMCLSCRNMQCQQLGIRNPGRILETLVLGEGGTSAVKGLGIALPKQNPSSSGSVTALVLYRQDGSKLWQWGWTHLQHPWSLRGLCNRNPPVSAPFACATEPSWNFLVEFLFFQEIPVS